MTDPVLGDLAPEQVRVLPISDKFLDYANRVLTALQSAGLRATLDHRPEKIGAKIRDAQLEKIPAMLVVGGKEAESESVSYRDRVDGDRIAGITWEGQGCSISMASASVMTSLLDGMPRPEAQALIEEFRTMLRSRGGGEPSEELGDAAASQGVARYVMRVKCAMLAWVALEACLLQTEA